MITSQRKADLSAVRCIHSICTCFIVVNFYFCGFTDIQSLWDQPCSDQHLQYISQFSIDLRLISPALGLTDIDELPVQVSVGTQISPFPDQAQNLEILRMWRGKFGSIASYRKLTDVLREHGRQDLVDRISELVTAAGETSVTLSPGDLTFLLQSTGSSIHCSQTLACLPRPLEKGNVLPTVVRVQLPYST